MLRKTASNLSKLLTASCCRLKACKAEDGRAVTYGIRPEHISIGEGGIPVKVSVFEPTGSETLIFGRLGGEPIDALLRERIDGEPGQTLMFRIDPRRAHVFDTETGVTALASRRKRWISQASGSCSPVLARALAGLSRKCWSRGAQVSTP